jgi:hypothetical protein
MIKGFKVIVEKRLYEPDTQAALSKRLTVFIRS